MALPLVSVLILSGCGGDDSASTDTDTDTTSPAAADDSEPADDGTATGGDETGGDESGLEDLVAAAQEEGQLTWYTAAALEASSAQAECFMEAYPEIEVEVFRQTGGPLGERFMADVQRGEIVADALLHSDPAQFNSWIDDGLISEYTPTAADQYPESTKQFIPHGWPDRLVPATLAYNSDLVTDEQAQLIEEQGYEALADPSFKDKVALVDPALTGSAFNYWYILIQSMGEEEAYDLLERIAENNPVFYESNVPASAAMASGEQIIGGPVVEFFPIDQVELGAPIQMVWPDPQPAYFGVLGAIEDSPNPNAGKLFVEWFLSSEGQACWAANYNARSANVNVEDQRAHTDEDWFEGQPEIEDFSFVEDLEAQEEYRDTMLEKFDEFFPTR